MLRPLPFANSLAILTGVFYVVIIAFGSIAPPLFAFVLNAQFLGADVASIFPKRMAVANFIGILITLIVTSWLFGYVWAESEQCRGRRVSQGEEAQVA